MGQFASKGKQGTEKTAQRTDKDGKDVNELIQFMKDKYDTKVKDVKSFDEFYHAIYEMIEMFCEERGQLQYKIPPKEDLKTQYEKARKGKRGGKVTKEEFQTITENLIGVGSFSVGKAAIDVLLVLFGAPACALLAKRFVPGIKSIPDQVVIPAATSGAVVFLAKTNKL